MTNNLAAQAVRGVAWTGLGQVMRQVVQVVGSIALARLLAPDDFGVLGMAMFFIGIGQLLADFGIGSALVQARTNDRVVFSSCFWLNFAVAGVMAATMALAAPFIADFYHRSDLAPVVTALSFSLLLSGLLAVPTALLYKDMKFADLAKAQVIGSLFGALAAIGLAWRGAGVWALVAQPVVGNLFNLAICMWAARWVPSFEFSWHRVAPLARFSMALLGTNLVGYANRNTDSLLIGRFIGAGPLGIYAMAMQLMLYPLQQVSSVIVRVLFPTLVHIKDDLPRLRNAYLKAIGAIAFVTFPMMGGLFAVADDFVFVVFGPKWSELAPLLKILAWVGMMQSIGTTMGTIYLTVGRPTIALRVSLIVAPIMVLAMAAGLPWGIYGVAVGYAVASFGLFYYTALTAFRLIDLRMKEFHAAMVRPLIAALGMVVVVLVVTDLLHLIAPMARLSLSIGSGVMVYGLLSMLVNRRQVEELLQHFGFLRPGIDVR